MEASGNVVSEEDPVAELAKSRFGIDYLFPLQRMSIANILDAIETGEKVRQLVLFPTGFGKSLCFQLPALLGPGPTVVVYPLLALMNDQKASLEKRGVPCAVFRGGMEEGERAACCEAVKSGAAKIVITNPECLATARLGKFLAGAKVFHVAIDEAHCVSEWGETFRPSYLKLGECIEAIRPLVVSAFTATASPAVSEAIARLLFGEESFSLVSADIDKPNIRYSVEPTLSPVHTLLRLVRERPKPLIVFDQSRAGVRRLCELIRDNAAIDARFYHAGLSREEKNAVEAWFMESADGVLTATCAYGMGVDKRNIRTVVHFSEPPSVEAYIQESGRGGRDGGPAEAILIHGIGGPRGGRVGAAAAEGGKAGSGESDRLRTARREAFMKYAVARTCRRAHLHELMGSELSSPCSGCDVCNGSVPDLPEGLSPILRFFGRNDGRFDIAQSVRLLRQPSLGALGGGAVSAGTTDSGGMPDSSAGAECNMSSYLHNPPTCAGAGLLSGWSEEEAAALIREAAARGILEIRRRGMRKGRLSLTRSSSPT